MQMIESNNDKAEMLRNTRKTIKIETALMKANKNFTKSNKGI